MLKGRNARLGAPEPPTSFIRDLARSTGLETSEEGTSSPSLTGKAAESVASEAPSPVPSGASAGPPVTLSHDLIGEGLENARQTWTRDADPKVLRRALLDLLRRLEGNE